MYMYTWTPIIASLALAGATLATSAKPAKGRPKWLPPVTRGVRVGECPYCRRQVLIGWDEGLPIALDLRLVRTDLEELALALGGIVCFWLWRFDGVRWFPTHRDQFNMRKRPRPRLVFPWHQCPAGKWRWSS